MSQRDKPNESEAQTAILPRAVPRVPVRNRQQDYRRRIERLIAERDAWIEYGSELERRYQGVLRSRSWSLTKPYRRLGHWVQGILGRQKGTLEDQPPRPGALEDPGSREFGRSRGPSAKAGYARWLGQRLWGGFSNDALQDLEDFVGASNADVSEQSRAAMTLACWYAARRDTERALEKLAKVKLGEMPESIRIRSMLLEADCLIRVGESEGARDILTLALVQQPGNPDLCLAMANTYASPDGANDKANDDLRLSWINRVYAAEKLLPLAKADPSRALEIDNLTSVAQRHRVPDNGPKVSVLMPVYKAEDILACALRGLLAQTWSNLEIIIVDDCSPDDTFAVAEDFARRDARVVALRQTRNQGAYVARNRALEAATGDLLTVHDADDWSHPQKIETQVQHLLGNHSALGNYCDWARVLPNLYFTGPYKAQASKLTLENLSSLLIGRGVLEEQGGWDTVRIAADREFMRRMHRRNGDKAIERVGPGVPLSFARNDPSSLTRNPRTNVTTQRHGIRREYAEAADYWHRHTPDPCLGSDASRRPFPVPGIMLPDVEDTVHCDVLFIMDFNRVGGTYHSTMNYVEAAMAHGLSVAIFHWPQYGLNIEPLNGEIRQMAHEGRLRIVSPGEKVHAATLIAIYPTVLQHAIDLCPRVEFDNFIVVVNQMAARMLGGDDAQYDPLAVRENLEKLFGSEGKWAPVSGLVRRLMDEDGRYPPVQTDTWVPLIDTATWCNTPLQWRGKTRQRPIVGRHGRDQYTKWPLTPDALRAAYCADRPCDVAILGGAKNASDVIGAIPENWTVQDFGAQDSQDFLKGLDFFVHFPHEDYIEEFGRCVIEAMAVGLPVILPPVFRENFGDAALYAEPEDVWPTIERLWNDEDAYLARAEAGRKYVLANCAWSQFPDRLKRLSESNR